MSEEKKPVVELSGHDGNAFIILGKCRKAAIRADWPYDKVKMIMDEMQSGDYDNLLQTAMKYFDVV